MKMHHLVGLGFVAAFVGAGSFAAYGEANYYWTGGGSGLYSEPSNWRIGGPNGEPATTCPGAEDTVKQPIATSGSVWRWDLGGGDHEVRMLSFTDNWGVNDTYAFRNGTLAVIMTNALLQKAAIEVSDGARLVFYGTAEFGRNYNAGNSRCKVTVGAGGTVEIRASNFLPRCVEFDISEGGSWLYGSDAVLQNCNKNFLWLVDNRGTATFENGLCTFSNTWSAPWRIRQLAGTMVWGGPFGHQNNLYYQIELTGGKVSATGDVSFAYNPANNNSFTFSDGADLDVEVAAGKTLDLTPFSYVGAATVRKTGAGALKLPDVPTALSMRGGPVTFAANLRTAMTSLEIGEGQTFPVRARNMTIDGLVALDGALSLAAPGLTVENCAFETVVGEVSVVKEAYEADDVIVSTPHAALRAAVKAAAEAAGMNVMERGEAVVVGEDSFLFDSTSVTDLGDAAGWRGGTLPPEGSQVVVSGAGVNAVASGAVLGRFSHITVSKGATLSVSGEATLPPLVVGSSSAVRILAGATATVTSLTPRLSDGADPATTLPRLEVLADATLVVPDAMKFQNMALAVNGTLAVDGGSVYLGYAAAGATGYFEMTADGGRILPRTSPETSGFKYYYLVPETGGRVKVPSGAIRLSNMPKESFAQGEQTFVFMGAESASRQNDKGERIELVLENATLFTRNKAGVSGTVLGRLGGGVVLRLKRGAAYRTWFADNAWGGSNGRCGGFALYGNAGIIMEEGSRFVLPIDCDGSFAFLPDSEREVLTVENAYLHLHKTTGNDKAAVRLTGARNVIEANFPFWYNQENGCDLFKGVKELKLDGAETKVTVVTWADGWTDNASVPKETRALARIFNEGAVVTGEGSVVIGSTETDQGEYGHSWHRDLTVLFGTSGNECSGTLSTGSDKAKVALLNGSGWAGTVVADGQVVIGDPLKAEAASVSLGKVRLATSLPLRVWRGEDGAVVSDTIALKEGFVVAEGDKGLVELVPQGANFELGLHDEVALGTFPSGAFSGGVQVKMGRRRLQVREVATGTAGVVAAKARLARGFAIVVR